MGAHAKFGDHRHCGKGDIMILLIPHACLYPSLLLSLKHMEWKHMACHVNKSDIGHTGPL